MPAGRPLKFATPKDLQDSCDAYFKDCDAKGLPYTIVGLAEGLGVTRQTVENYKEREEFLDILEEARVKCERWLTDNALLNKSNSGFTQFILKNSHGYKDKQEVENSGETSMTIKWAE